MKKQFLFKSLLFAAAVASVATSCTKDDAGSGSDFVIDPQTTLEGEGYIVAATTSGYDYLLYTDALDKNISVTKNSVETSVTSGQWYFYSDMRVLGLKYNDGDPVPAESFVMGTTKPTSSTQYTSYRFTTYGTYGESIITSSSNALTAASDTNGDYLKTISYEGVDEYAGYSRFINIAMYHSTNGTVATYDFESDNFLGNGEYVNFAGFAESDGNLYTTVYPMGITAYGSEEYKSTLEAASTTYYGDSSEYEQFISPGYGGSGSGSFYPGTAATTLFPNQFHVAIFPANHKFSNDNKTPNKSGVTIITDDRMSPPCGRQQSSQYPTIGADDNEDIYIFSPGNERSYTSGVVVYSDSSKTVTMDASTEDPLFYKALGTHASKVMRIKKGATALDETYGSNGVFDVEAAMGGRSFLTCDFITGSGSKFLLRAYNDANVQYTSNVNFQLYVVDAANQTATMVTGQPSATSISNISRNSYFEDGKAYVGITSSELSYPAIYEIDSATGVATKIADVECTNIASIGKLKQF